MGKKLKKEDNSSPVDKFDEATIESKQAATVVLMLTSPEYEVQSQASAAIFNFVKKTEENQKQLVDLGAVEGLLNLLVSEEKEVRRNAMMALAVITAHPDARRILRKLEHGVPTVLALLSSNESVTVWEFACLCLENLAAEFSSIASIVENEGLPRIVEALRKSDPDVRQHGVACLNLLLQDPNALEIIRQIGGLEVLLGLLDSEFPIIQTVALQALIKATLNAANQAEIRFLEGFTTMVEILQRPECNDLHVLAINALANCAANKTNLKAMKERGALSCFVGFITEPEISEEEKAALEKGKKKGGSGKKGKKDEVKKEDESIPSNENPEVKMHACTGIGRLANLDENRKMLHESEAEKKLIFLLNHDDEAVRVSAAQGLAVMGQTALCQDTIVKNEGMEPLLKMAKSEHPEPKESALLCFANLTTSNLAICQNLAAKQGIEILITSLANENERIVVSAIATLCNLATEDFLRSKCLSAGLLAALSTPLNSSAEMVMAGAAQLVASFICDGETIAAFRAKGLLEQLYSLLLDNHSSVRRAACWALTNLLVNSEIAAEIFEMGGLEVLLNFAQSSTKNDRFVGAALERLLSHNLTAKYAYTGYLSATDVIGSEFFDLGQLKLETKLLSLETYFNQEVNTKRAVLSIYLAPQKVVPEVTNEEEAAEEKEEVPVEVAEAPEGEVEGEPEEEEVVFTPPEDSNLQKYVNDCRETVVQLPTYREQVVALAKFVAEQMGGAIQPNDLMHFSYELPISELKLNIRSNVIPLGLVTTGIHYHRSLLFKFLADQCGVACTLERGEYNRGWNRVLLNVDDQGRPVYPPISCLVDLMHSPGRFISVDSDDAILYTRI